jgi:hypothetical protein
MSYNEQIQKRIIEQYRACGQEWPASSIDIARWAVAKKLWEIHPAAVIRQCADQIADAMRDEFITDPQGRRIRAKHAAPYQKEGRQTLLWDDIRTAPRTHMELAFAQRRQQIVMDCRQLKLDLDSYNQNYNDGKSIQTVFDFSYDLEELEIGSTAA